MDAQVEQLVVVGASMDLSQSSIVIEQERRGRIKTYPSMIKAIQAIQVLRWIDMVMMKLNWTSDNWIV